MLGVTLFIIPKTIHSACSGGSDGGGGEWIQIQRYNKYETVFWLAIYKQ